MSRRGLPIGWVETTLGDIGRWTSGGTPSRRNADYYGGDIPWIKTGDLTDGPILDVPERITECGLENSSAKLFPAETLLIAMYGATIGKLGTLQFPAATNQACAALLPEGETRMVLPWVERFLLSERTNLRSRGQGGAQPNISQTVLKAYSLPLAPVAEQKRIVAKLDALQARSRRAREALDAIPALLDRFRQSVLAAAFRGDLTADWRAKNPDVEPASVLLERIRAERKVRWIAAEAEKARARAQKRAEKKGQAWGPADDAKALEAGRTKAEKKYTEPEPVDAEGEGLNDLPNGWAWARLEELTPGDAPIVYGIILPKEHIPQGVPYVRPADIVAPGEVVFDNLLRTAPEIALKYERASLDVGDLIYSIVGTIGKWVVAGAQLKGANITQSSVRIRPVPPLHAKFVLRALQSQQVQSQVARFLFGNAVQRLNVAHVRALAVPLPPSGERELLEQKLSQVLRSIHALENQVGQMTSALDTQERAILAKAFRGELVPQDPNDEPASVLLERIRAEREAATPKKKTRRKRS